MSFDMSMNYINNELMRSYNLKSQEETRNKQQREASQL
jgi:hypothetical protein